jgi:hypothetical protein
MSFLIRRQWLWALASRGFIGFCHTWFVVAASSGRFF